MQDLFCLPLSTSLSLPLSPPLSLPPTPLPQSRPLAPSFNKRCSPFVAPLPQPPACTLVEAVGGVLVLLPADLVIPVHVILPPVFVHVLLDVPPLAVLDPVVQLAVVHVAVLVDVDAADDLPAKSIKAEKGVETNQVLVEWLCGKPVAAVRSAPFLWSVTMEGTWVELAG